MSISRLHRRLRTFLSTLAILAVFLAPNATESTINRLSVIGDSLTDTGNVFRLTQHKIPPSEYYFEGRFTNGEVWVDVLSRERNITVRNFAFGGATSDGSFVRGTRDVPSGVHQVDEILRRPTPAVEGHLYAVWIGSNDYLDMAKRNPRKIDDEFIKRSERTTVSIIRRLIKSGAKSIMTLTVPPLARTPLIRGTPLTVRKLVAKAVKTHNDMLRQEIRVEVQRAKRQNRLQLRVGIFDAYSLSILTIDNRLFGFENVENPCLSENLEKKAVASTRANHDKAISDDCNRSGQSTGMKQVCLNPDRYFFYDQVHPTTKVHRVLGRLLNLFIHKCYEREIGGRDVLGECMA